MSANSTKGITISVTAETNAGGRRHMEDYLAVKLCPNERLRQVPHLREQAYIGVFDGHGGKEAAKFARERLWEVIQDQPKYQMNDVESVCDSLREAFVALHREMEPLRASWKTNKMGDLSTAGTTASTIIFRQNCIFVANVGDSTAVLAETNPKAGRPGQHAIIARVLTKDHKPDDPFETQQVERLGGRVMVSRKGVPRVVWERRRNGTTNGEQFDLIPFLSVSRSLGDFWSYCPRSGEFVVSPRPDVYVHVLNAMVQKFIVIASDGLWNVMSPKQVVEFIWDYEHAHEDTLHQPRDVVRAVINKALSRWNSKHLLADNIAVLIAFISEDDYCSPSLADVTPSVEEEVASTAIMASPTPSSEVGSSPELRAAKDIPPLQNDSPASSASPSNAPSPSPMSSPSTSTPSPSSPAGPSSSTSPSDATSAPSTSPQQNQVEQQQQQQQQQPEVVNTVHKTRDGSTSYYKETFADGVTVECHTKIRLRHRKRHHNSHSKVKATSSSVGGAGSSTNSADTTEDLRPSPQRPEETNADECSSKKLKLDLPDSSCNCNSDKMDTQDSSPLCSTSIPNCAIHPYTQQ